MITLKDCAHQNATMDSTAIKTKLALYGIAGEMIHTKMHEEEPQKGRKSVPATTCHFDCGRAVIDHTNL